MRDKGVHLSEPRTQRSGVSGRVSAAYSAALRARLGLTFDQKQLVATASIR